MIRMEKDSNISQVSFCSVGRDNDAGIVQFTICSENVQNKKSPNHSECVEYSTRILL